MAFTDVQVVLEAMGRDVSPQGDSQTSGVSNLVEVMQGQTLTVSSIYK